MNVKDILPDLLSTSSMGLRRSEIRELLKLTREPGMISFAGGLPSPALFPAEEVKEVVKDILDKEPQIALQYGPTEGDKRLIRFLAEWMKRKEGADIDEKNILIVSGSQQALDLIGKIFIDPGDPVIVGLPSYLGAIQAFIANRAKLLGVPVDNQGMDVDRVEQILKDYAAKGKKIKFVYIVPDFQNPSGVTMSLERRQNLLNLCYQYETIVFEDTPYRELRFEGESLPMVAVIDKKGYGFSLHTFSKILFPGMRLGWLVANKAIMDKLVLAKQSTDLCTSPFAQSIVYEYCRRGLLEPHIKRIVEVYRKKRNMMIQALKSYMPHEKGLYWTEPQGGLFLWLSLPERVDTEELFPKAVAKKVAYIIGAAFHCDRSGKNTMRLNFSFPSEDQIDEGIKRLAEVVKEAL